MVKRNIVGKIQMRNDTADTWERKNPVLDVGEIGYDITNKRTKIGDGNTPWNELFWFSTETTPNFATNTWSVIEEYSKKGTADKVYSIGDEKTIELTTGEQVTLVILGFNHDYKATGGTAGITIGMKGLLNDKYKWLTVDDNSCSWKDSYIRTNTMKKLFSLLPNDLQEVIKAVLKKTNIHNDSIEIVTTEDKLWLLSIAEIYSHKAIENSLWNEIRENCKIYNDEGEQYEYWKNKIHDQDPHNGSIELEKSNIDWWTRTPFATITSNGIWYVNHVGMINSSYKIPYYGVSFCFCI